MFALKKLIYQSLLPMPFCLILCMAGLGLLWWTKKQKAGKILVTIGLGLLTVLSLRPVSNLLLGSLERQYSVYQGRGDTNISFVVVLGGGHTSDPTIPTMSQLSDDSLKRLVEGIRIHREHPQSKLVLSGGRWRDPVPNAKLMADSAMILGVKEADIILETESKDSKDEALLLKPILGTNLFVLVTSANHMPRAMRLFTVQGMQPVPAPVGHRVTQAPFSLFFLFPAVGFLDKTETAAHEYLGLAWVRISASM